MREPNWTYKELDILRMYYGRMSDEELAKKLKRTPGAVQTRANLIGIKKPKEEFWTPQKIKLLTDFFDLMFNKDLALWLGVNERTLRRKANELGLKKSEAFYKRKRSVMLERQSEGLKKIKCATRFKKGQRSSPATEFKKGSRVSQESIAKRTETRMRTLKRKKAALLEQKLKAQIKSTV